MSSPAASDDDARRRSPVPSDDEDDIDTRNQATLSIKSRSAIDLPEDDDSPDEDEEPRRRNAIPRKPLSPKREPNPHDEDDENEITPFPRKGDGPISHRADSDGESERRTSEKRRKMKKRRSGKRDLSEDEYSDGEDGLDGRTPKKVKREYDGDENAGDEDAPPERKMTAFEKAQEQAKAARRSRKRELNPDDIEKECVAFLERMMKARDDDIRSFKKGQPALEKIKMLRVVEMMMTKVQHREYLLDNMLLPVFKAWLDRLPDGTLPNVQVRTTLLTILYDLRVDEDWVDHLEQSQGLGKVVHFLSKKEDYEPNRRLAEKIMMKWARPVYKMNSNFNELLDEFDKPEDGHRAPKDSVAAERKAAMRTVRNMKRTEERLLKFDTTRKRDTQVLAAMPKPTPFLFTTVAEGSGTIDENAVKEGRSNRAKTRKINRTMSTLRRMNKRNLARGSGPSVNGR